MPKQKQPVKITKIHKFLDVVFIAALIVVFLTFFFHWQVALACVVSGVVWTNANDEEEKDKGKAKNTLLRWMEPFFGASTLGLALACLIALLVGISGKFEGKTWLLWAIESKLIELRLALGHWTKISLPILVTLLVVMLIVGHYRARLALVRKFAKVRNVVAQGMVVLTAMLSFSYFSSLPLDRSVERETLLRSEEFAINLEDYSLMIRMEWNYVGTALACDQIAEDLTSMSPEQKSNFQAKFTKWAAVIDREAIRTAREKFNHDLFPNGTVGSSGFYQNDPVAEPISDEKLQKAKKPYLNFTGMQAADEITTVALPQRSGVAADTFLREDEALH